MARPRKVDSEPTAIFTRRLSPNQFALMRAIHSGEARHGYRTLEILNYTTFSSLIKRGYLSLDARQNPTFTAQGSQAYRTYLEMDMPVRNHPGKVTEFVAQMFRIARERNGDE
jgi:hypothetical protein